MLISLTALATVLLTASASWFSDGVGDATLPTGDTAITPRDPSSLTLALIGAGTMAFYVLAKRRPSRDGARRLAAGTSDQSQSGASFDREERRRSRGAA